MLWLFSSHSSWRAATYASTFGSLLMLCESSTSMEDGTSRSCGVASSSVGGWSGTASAFAKEDEATVAEMGGSFLSFLLSFSFSHSATTSRIKDGNSFDCCLGPLIEMYNYSSAISGHWLPSQAKHYWLGNLDKLQPWMTAWDSEIYRVAASAWIGTNQ